MICKPKSLEFYAITIAPSKSCTPSTRESLVNFMSKGKSLINTALEKDIKKSSLSRASHYMIYIDFSQVGAGSNLRTRITADILDDHCLARLASDTDINTALAKSRGVLEIVVVCASGALPVASAISANLKLSDFLTGIDNLHREPVLRGTLLVLELKRAIDVTGGVGVTDVNNAG